ncbi:amino acid permease-domain-containing protein, partial [Dactylonectria estremocensis]
MALLQTQRGLSPRHLQLMAIAGSIGVGLFVGVGGILASAGPLPLVTGYVIYGLGFIWPTTLNTAEMVAWLPIRGSIYELAARFVDPALGFAMGWTYFFGSVMLVCTEYSAVATVMQYWNTTISPAVWVAMATSVCYFLNMVAVRWYGESEFIMGSTKVLLILGLILATFITMVGGNPRHDAYGFRNWTNGDLAHPYYTSGAAGIFLSVCISVRYGVFTVGGPEILSVAAGEIRNPRKTIPKVAKMIIARLLFFYVIGVLAVGILCNSRDPRLMGAIESGDAGAAASPWVLGLLNLGITGFLPGFINVLILLSGWSCANAYLYASSPPKFFLKCTKSGVPWVAVTAVTFISLLSFLVASNDAIVVFGWFVDLTTSSNIVFFTAISWVFIGEKHDQQEFLEYFPSIFIGFDIFHPWSTRGFITSYFGVAWFLGMFVFWKIFKRTKFVNPATVDIYADGKKQAIDDECRIWEEGLDDERVREELRQKNVVVRAWARFWGN